MDTKQDPNQEPKQNDVQLGVNSELNLWEYKVIHINTNVQNTAKIQTSTPERDSQKLQGALSPEFIKKEFPKMYQQNTAKPKHPAQQLEVFLNTLGKDRWELVETSQVGELLMFFFKRLLLKNPDNKSDLQKDSNHSKTQTTDT
ncbi:hypothetical protein N9A81_01950 [Synechococcus sp. AH-707-M23]|nr:hypothetical protein [Synechococcus sp. AH-707-M23]